MAVIYSTSTDVSTGSTTLSTVSMSADLSYIVILLMVIAAILFLDLLRRVFSRK